MAPFGKIYSYPGNFRVQRVRSTPLSTSLCRHVTSCCLVT